MKNMANNLKHKHYILFITLLALLVFQGNAAEKSKKIDISRLDRYIENARKDWKIPGMAVAIVKDGRIVLAKGYGVKEFSKKEKVDERTLFAIASNTKAFTAASLALLVEERRIKWDDKVRKYLPYFTLYDPYVSEEIRIRDLLCHRSGLKTFSGDLLWYETPYSAVEIIERARYLKPTFGFRSGYGYSNIMFMAAGEVVSAVVGRPWKDYVKKRIFKPLGMTDSHMGVRELKKYDNVATPHHVPFEGETATIPYTTSDTMGPAGAINSNVSEMARWITMWLNDGVFENRRILSEDSIREMWTPHTPIRLGRSTKTLFPSTHFKSYGLGWVLMDYQGYEVVYHSGALDGMISRVALVPELNLGMVILTNSINSLPGALKFRIIDAYVGVKPRDWSRLYLDRYREAMNKDKQLEAEKKQENTPKKWDNLTLSDYTGRYGGPMYGDAEVTLEKGKLVLNLLPAPIFISDLTYLHYDTFQLKLRNVFSFIPDGTGTVQFLRDKDGSVVEMKVDIPNRDFFFDELEFKKRK
jgi:CubicO group peptidase (beta-lactamase class C family)